MLEAAVAEVARSHSKLNAEAGFISKLLRRRQNGGTCSTTPSQSFESEGIGAGSSGRSDSIVKRYSYNGGRLAAVVRVCVFHTKISHQGRNEAKVYDISYKIMGFMTKIIESVRKIVQNAVNLGRNKGECMIIRTLPPDRPPKWLQPLTESHPCRREYDA